MSRSKYYHSHENKNSIFIWTALEHVNFVPEEEEGIKYLSALSLKKQEKRYYANLSILYWL